MTYISRYHDQYQRTATGDKLVPRLTGDEHSIMLPPDTYLNMPGNNAFIKDGELWLDEEKFIEAHTSYFDVTELKNNEIEWARDWMNFLHAWMVDGPGYTKGYRNDLAVNTAIACAILMIDPLIYFELMYLDYLTQDDLENLAYRLFNIEPYIRDVWYVDLLWYKVYVATPSSFIPDADIIHIYDKEDNTEEEE